MLEEKKILMDKIEHVINQKPCLASRYFNKGIITYLYLSILNIGLSLFMAWTYRDFPYTFWTAVGLCIFSFVFLLLSLFIRKEVNQIYDFNQPVANLIQKHLDFFKKEYQLMMYLKPLAYIIMSVSITTIMDFENREYLINNKWMYFLIYLFVYIFIIIQDRLFSAYNSAEYIHYLKSLDSENKAYDFDAYKKRSLIYRIVLIMLFLAILLSGAFTYNFVYSH
ncbi:MAG TPA: hypothetical protein PKJ08_02150 [Candidatus Cloacimonadota bacterium]|nr:hypothetical protein [Candidatus Cloacimonadota bacterium]HOD53305.1 hypothetical protein [Candidatus Cloacimonadota bacterium]HPM00967.1 hypothetical protein [Candidatus Cloacimonadota bacterium]